MKGQMTLPGLESVATSPPCHNCQLRKEIRLLRWQMKELLLQFHGKVVPDGDEDHKLR